MSDTDIVVAKAKAAALSFPVTPGPATPPAPTLETVIQGPSRAGYALIAVFVVGFFVWAGFAPLASGAVAPGIISPDSSRRVVQHLEGGIVREMRVQEGQSVEAGQPLVVLEPVQPRSAHEALLGQRQSLLAKAARLEAEKSQAGAIAFPDELAPGGKLTPIALSQKEMFEARLATHQARQSVLRQRIEQLTEQIKGFTGQSDNIATQLAFVREELGGKNTLLTQGLVSKTEVLRLRRSETELLGRQSEFATEIGKAKQQIGEVHLQLLSADAARLDEITAEAEKVRAELVEVGERLRASQDVLSRTTISAPVTGKVINLRVKTVGGVVQRGEPIMEIVPNDDALMIEARVAPNDIHLVHPGQVAQIHLAAYSSRVMPRLKGLVRTASPDRVTEPSGQRIYFLARVEVDREDLKKQAGSVTLIPGMAAEVIFVTEERTLLQYLLQPFRDILRRGLRES